MYHWYPFFRRVCQLRKYARPALIPAGAALCYSFFPFGSYDGSSGSGFRRKGGAPCPLYIWGDNSGGLIDPAGDAVVQTPVRVILGDGRRSVISVSASARHMAVVDDNGDLWQWGAGTPPTKTLTGRSLCQVSCNDLATFALDSDGRVYAIRIGDKYDGMDIGQNANSSPSGWFSWLTSTGNPGSTNSEKSAESTPQDELKLTASKSPVVSVSLYKGEKITKISTGHNHLVALTNYGTVLTASLNDNGNIVGQLGRGATESTRSFLKSTDDTIASHFGPDQLLGFMTSNKLPDSEEALAKRLSATDETAVKSRQLYSSIQLEPIPRDAWNNKLITDISCGDHHTLALSSDGHAFGFGSNEMLQLGIGPYEKSRLFVPVPVQIDSVLQARQLLKQQPQIETSRVSAIAAGGQTSYFVVDDNEACTVYATGMGLYGQLGNGHWLHVSGTPVKVQVISGLTYYDERTRSVRPLRCRYISAGSQHAAAVMNTFTPTSLLANAPVASHGYDVYVWGNNFAYQLGIGRHNNVAIPMSPQPETISSIVATPLGSSDSSEKSSQSESTANLLGASLTNAAGTLALIAGQFQFLPNCTDSSKSINEAEPAQRIYCGPDITVIY